MKFKIYQLAIAALIISGFSILMTASCIDAVIEAQRDYENQIERIDNGGIY